MGIKRDEKVLQPAIGKGQHFALDGDRYFFFCWTPWTRVFCQHPLPGVNAIERILSAQSRPYDGKTDHPTDSRKNIAPLRGFPRRAFVAVLVVDDAGHRLSLPSAPGFAFPPRANQC